MNTLAQEVKKRFRSAFNASPYKSLRQLSEDSDCNPAQAGKIIRGGFDGSSDGPGLFSCYRLAESLGVGLSDILPPKHTSIGRPGVSAFFARYNRNNPRLEDFRDLLEFCDVFAEPKKGKSKILFLGRYSLLALKTDISDPAIHQAEYDSWSRERRTRIYQWQRRAWEIGALAEPEDFTGDYRSADRSIQTLILRAACRVLDDNLKPRLLVYCDQLWQ